jgi:hypothetical protein
VSGVADTGCILRIAEYFLLWKNPVKNSPARRMSQGGQAGAGDRNVAHRSVRDRIGESSSSAIYQPLSRPNHDTAYKGSCGSKNPRSQFVSYRGRAQA